MITFSSKYHADIMMFDEVGRQLLKMANLSATVPGALKPEQVLQAKQALTDGLAHLNEELDGSDEQPSIGLSTRALPLLQLMDSALANDEYVMWK
ncbi:DUF1840 domain-containing protein [Paraferrimonas haliotis]|uniref:DUF1840 domain-containing protein n=1 Tax=Paraferrimonas haliotis TaxID=2013866 RepID=A0AA37TUG6_9GAMM|nr:DUF1840 domain-containing protein [Paraferrimonas haliotis]GLS82990.1 hypothetical protein GCM10007894_09670 [Paraferrimonas haliotis]